MLAHHRDLGITPEQRFRFASPMSLAAMHNSEAGADVGQQAPVPRWGWGVAPPYQP